MTKERLLRSGSSCPANCYRGPRVALLVLAAVAGGGMELAAQTPQTLPTGTEPNPLDANIQVLDQWVQARRTLAEERAQWQGDKARLQDMIELRRAQLTQLDEQIASLAEEGNVAERERSTLAADLDQKKQVEQQIDKVISEAEARMRALLPRLPVPLQEELRPLSVRLPNPQSKENTTLSTGVRMQTIVGLLSQIEKYNDAVDLNQESYDDNGTRVQIEVIYFGLAAAYWVDGTGTLGGTAVPTPQGWVRTKDNTLAPKIRSMIEMYKGTTTNVAYVTLPVEVVQ